MFSDRFLGHERFPPPSKLIRSSGQPTIPEQPSVYRSSHPATLPLLLTPLIGREREVAAVCTLLARPEVRFLTLTGTGGVGKTRLAFQIATEVRGSFTDGACFVSLAPIQDPELVFPTVVQALGLQGSSSTGSPLDLLKAALREHHLLLLLDNFEQVVVEAPRLLELLAACPSVKLLVTSREALHVRGERVFAVPPLALPDLKHLPDEETLSRYEAVALFLERAREVASTFQLTAKNAPLIAEICVRLDGLALAIELAAARLKLLPLPALLERLEHRLDVLTDGPRDLPARQHTLRDSITWSYQLLSEEEQQLFRLLSVFVGGCTLEAVEVISAGLGGEKVQVLDHVTSLLNKHLLRQIEQERLEQGDQRLLMLETIREYAWEALEALGELEAVRQAHATYYLRLAEEAEAHLFGAEQGRWLDQLTQEYGNVRSALSWAMEEAEAETRVRKREMALRLAGALVRYWAVRGPLSEGLAWLERVLANTESVPAPIRIKALSGASWLAFFLGNVERAKVLCEGCLQLYHTAREAQDVSGSLLWLGWLPLIHGPDDEIGFLLEESHTLARNRGDKINLAYLLHFLGVAAIEQGAYAEAHSLLEESQRYHRERDNKEDLVWSFLYLGQVCFAQGEALRAYALVEEGLALAKGANYPMGSACLLYLLGRFALAQECLTKAQPWLEESLALFETLGLQRNVAYVLAWLAGIALTWGDRVAASILCERSITLFRQMDDLARLAFCLQEWGCRVARRGDTAWAAQLWGAAETPGRAGQSVQPFDLFTLFTIFGEHTDYEHMRAAVRIELGEQTFAQAWAEGQAMTLEHVIAVQEQPMNSGHARAMARRDRHERPSPPSLGNLSEREVEVLRLVARGLTDAQVAHALVISSRTVNAHLRSIFSKLNTTSRTAATYVALEQHLI